MAALDALFADDVVWHVAGRGPTASDFTGKEQGFGQLGQFMERSGGTCSSADVVRAGSAEGWPPPR